MEKANGIGGIFFRSRDPKALSLWYHQNLGIAPPPGSYEPWQQSAGPTVFAPFANNTEYFGKDQSKQWMINLRVDNLDAMVAQLRAAEIAVEVDATDYPHGRFARLYDPEGNPIELWQPA